MCELYGVDIIQELKEFLLDVGKLPFKLYTDSYNQMIWGVAQKYLLSNDLKIVASPAGLQSQNGQFENT